jgi:hypothetical protein
MPPSDTLPRPPRGLTVIDVSRRYRVSPDTVRAWIRSGELDAISTASARSGRPRFVVMPEALERFERGRAAAVPPPPRRRRRARIDYFADL